MGKLRLAVTNYRDAEAQLFNEVFDILASTDGLLSKLQTRRTVHSGPTRNVRNPVILDQPLTTIEHRFEIPFDVVRLTDVEQFTILAYDLANAFKKSTAQSMFSIIDAVTDATGNTIDAQGQELSHDMIIDMMERVDIHFDEDGNHNSDLMITPEMAAKLANIPWTEEQTKRLNEVLSRKKEDFYAKKSHRKLY